MGCLNIYHSQQSDGDKSDQDLVVDDASDCPTSPVQNGTASPRENGIDKIGVSALSNSSSNSSNAPTANGQSKNKDMPPHSPRSGTSSNASTPSAKKMEEREKGATTPISKPMTPTSASTVKPGSSSAGSKVGVPGLGGPPPPPSSVPTAYGAHYPPGPPPHLGPAAQHQAHMEQLMAYNGYAAPRPPPTLQQQLYDPHAAMRVAPPPALPVGALQHGGKP